MDYPQDLKYTKEHEWMKVEADEATVGITDYAQEALGDVVFVELPKKGDSFEKNKSVAVIESVKSVSDVFAPVSGQVNEVNEAIDSNPELLNKSPYKDGWIFKMKMKDASEADDLMDASEYEKYVSENK